MIFIETSLIFCYMGQIYFFYNINRRLKMYKRQLSPQYSRAATYMDALEKDETINVLRKEYTNHRVIEAEYCDLKYEIEKAERENQILEERNLEIKEEYMEKITCNKALINDLCQQVQQIEQKIKASVDKGTEKQTQNEAIIEDIKLTKVKVNDCEQENQQLEVKIASQENTISTLLGTIEDLKMMKKEVQIQNKSQSESIEREFNDYKALQERAKADELMNAELKQELGLLKVKKAKFMAKVEQTQEKMRDLKKKLDQSEQETEKIGIRCHEAERESTKAYGEALTLKQNIEGCLAKNKEHTAKLKTIELILKQNVNNHSVKQTTKQKMAVQFIDLSKQIDKSESVLEVIDNDIAEQEWINKSLIDNLKKSIQSDEEAVKALTRKAALLNLISQV